MPQGYAWVVRFDAVCALGKLGNKEILNELQAALEQENKKEVRDKIKEVIEKLSV